MEAVVSSIVSMHAYKILEYVSKKLQISSDDRLSSRFMADYGKKTVLHDMTPYKSYVK